MPTQTEQKRQGDSGNGIALLYLEKSERQGVAFLPSPAAEISWEPAQLKLLYQTDQNELLWKTSEPEIGQSKSFSDYAVLQYREAEKLFSAEERRETEFNTIG